MSIEQYTRTWGNGLLVRMKGDPSLAVESVRKALQRVMPGTSYITVRPLSDIVENARVSWRMGQQCSSRSLSWRSSWRRLDCTERLATASRSG